MLILAVYTQRNVPALPQWETACFGKCCMQMGQADMPLVQVWLCMLIMGFISAACSWSQICHSDFQVICDYCKMKGKRELLAEPWVLSRKIRGWFSLASQSAHSVQTAPYRNTQHTELPVRRETRGWYSGFTPSSNFSELGVSLCSLPGKGEGRQRS